MPVARSNIMVGEASNVCLQKNILEHEQTHGKARHKQVGEDMGMEMRKMRWSDHTHEKLESKIRRCAAEPRRWPGEPRTWSDGNQNV